jgi:O-antigen ligase
MAALASGVMLHLLLVLTWPTAVPQTAHELPGLLPVAGLALLIAGALSASWLLAQPHRVLFAVLVCCAGLPDLMEGFSIRPAGFNIFGQDILLMLVAADVLRRFLCAPAGSRLPTGEAIGADPLALRAIAPLLPALAIFFCMGFLQMGRGIALGSLFHDALGDFRRGYVYLLLFLYPATLPDASRTVRTIRAALLTAAGIHVLTALGQLALGQLERRMVLDAAHVLHHFTLVVVAFAAYEALSRLLQRGEIPGGRLLPMAVFAITSMIVVVGNFRSVWLGFVAGGIMLLILGDARVRARLIGVGMVGLVAMVAALALAWGLPAGHRGETVGEEIGRKIFLSKEFRTDLNIIWRQQSYAAALERWRERPALGAGLGVMNSFFVLTSAGDVRLAERHRVHNSYLWILQTTGMVGIVLFVWLHGGFVWLALRGIRKALRAGGEPPVLAMALLAFYTAFMVTSGFDVLLEMSTRILTLALAMSGCLIAAALSASSFTPRRVAR